MFPINVLSKGVEIKGCIIKFGEREGNYIQGHREEVGIGLKSVLKD
jgi:hypothetical protein